MVYVLRLAIPYRANHSLVPIEVRPNAGTALAAFAAGEAILDVAQPEIARPTIPAGRDRVAAAVVRAADQNAAHALLAQLGEGDLDRAGRGHHAPDLGADQAGREASTTWDQECR